MSDLDPLAAVTKAIHDLDCEQGDACQMLLDLHGRYARYAQAAIDAMQAHQLPDGGAWITHTGHLHAGELCSTGRESDTHQRAVWLGPVKPIALKSTESAATGADVESPTDG